MQENGVNAGNKQSGETGEHRIGLLEVIVAVVTYFAVQIASIVILLGVLGSETDITQDPEATVGLVATAGLSALIAALVANAIRVRSLASMGLVGTGGRWLLIGAGAGLLAYFVNRVVVLLYIWISGDTSNPQQGIGETAVSGSIVQFILLIVLGGLLTPLGEELLFRGILFRWLRRWGFVLAAIISAVVFGIAHGFNVVLPAAIILGLLNAYVYEKSGSIWPAIISHATHNILAFAITRVLAEAGVLG